MSMIPMRRIRRRILVARLQTRAICRALFAVVVGKTAGQSTAVSQRAMLGATATASPDFAAPAVQSHENCKPESGKTRPSQAERDYFSCEAHWSAAA